MSKIGVVARRWLESPWVNNAFRIIAIVSLLIGLSVGKAQYDLTQCQLAYNNATNAATALRSEAAAADRKALDDMIGTFAGARNLPPGEAGPAVVKALDDYIAARKAADEQRRSNPLPAPPSQTC